MASYIDPGLSTSSLGALLSEPMEGPFGNGSVLQIAPAAGRD
jgi:hypothetical protein